MSDQNNKSDVVMVLPHQIGYLRVICAAASRAAARAQEAAASARLELADAIGTSVQAARLQHSWRLQREAIQKMNIVLFFGQLYVAAFRRHPPQGPLLAWDEGVR